MNSPNYYSDLISRIREIQKVEIPGNLLSRQPVRTGAEFDPNGYFEILTHLSLETGYILDFAYEYHEGLGGHPCLYARPVNDAPFESISQHQVWEENYSVFDYLIADGSPESFFELVVFREIANQFYLYWHASYNDLRIITAKDEIEKVISLLNKGGWEQSDPEQVQAALKLNPNPEIELTETSASVIYCTFTKWGGFTLHQEIFSRAHPHMLLCKDVLQTVTYNCGIVY